MYNIKVFTLTLNWSTHKVCVLVTMLLCLNYELNWKSGANQIEFYKIRDYIHKAEL